ncbi:MAG: hypothetical protein A2W28_00675 [Gammaproteobacteria bacterium RBG_16_51_14]|nr:MAG: hypothetical protein A2W28_00675 [Gammaproteobacteria bacterium RBG_16_51_14]
MDPTKLLSVLLSWAVQLTSYPHPHILPVIEYKNNDFFVQYACNGKRNCRVAAWYNNDGIININNVLKDQTDPMTRGIIVHELVHYLQDLSGKFDNKDCQDQQVREREAYAIQRAYLHTVAGAFIAIYMDFPPCPG